ncbi:MAG: hypothetical protein SFW08_06580 [Gemmatimonadaceae bacterium]|nr:hypothetical protein [Gemmatimonadaceae bacterium]
MTIPIRIVPSRPRRPRRALLLPALVAVAVLTACGRGGPGVISDATYVRVMADLMTFDLIRRARPVPPLPATAFAPVLGTQVPDTSWKIQRRTDSLAIARKDSLSRDSILVLHGVSEADLEAKVRSLVDDTKRARALWDSISSKAQTAREQSRAASAPAPSS